jgi:hypothetical protein
MNQQQAMGLLSLTPEQLAAMDHATLYNARAHIPQEQQGLLAPYEHRAFAREATQENPLLALPIAAGTLAYPFYKQFSPGRSPASLSQVGQGLTGVGEGFYNRMMGLLR